MSVNPNGYAGSTLNQLQDAGPLEEGCDLMTCTARVGGEHSPACNRCGICGRDTSDGLYINTSRPDGSVERVCDICVEKADDGIDIPLDMTEDEPDGWREGRPEFNGAFKSW